MRKVILTVGPQCAGKSSFCQKAVALDPDIILVSRDAICIELFGSVWLSPYTGGHLVAWEKMWEILKEHLKQESVRILLDAWNDSPESRRKMTTKLRQMGVDRIEAWHFITPENVCFEWFFQREIPNYIGRMKKYHMDNYCRVYRAFQKYPVDVEQGFDRIVRIDASTKSPEHVLSFQTSLEL